MNGECNATNVQGKNYNLHKLQGGHVPQYPIAGDATDSSFSTPNGMAVIRRGPLTGAPNARRGYDKSTMCDQYRALYWN